MERFWTYPNLGNPSPETSSTAAARSKQFATGQLVAFPMRAGLVRIRDAVAADAEAYVHYWHYSGERTKEVLGIDPEKLGGPSDSRTRFLQMIRTPGTPQENTVFTIVLNDEVIGYTNINRVAEGDMYAHLHLYRSRLRKALLNRTPVERGTRGAGLAAVLIGEIIAMDFRLFAPRRIVLQTRPGNRWINKALDLYFPVSETKFVHHPAGLAAAGKQHLRYVFPQDAAWIQARARMLAQATVGLKA